MSKKETKAKIKAIVRELLSKAKTLVLKLVKTKLLPKAEEKYCKVLQATSVKLVDKAEDLVEEVNSEEDTKKKVRSLYLLKLCVDTFDAVGGALTEASASIKELVKFEELDADDEDTKVALAELDTEDTPDCGPDGCAIG